MNEIIEAAKAVPELAKAVYSDGVAGTLKQIGKIGEDAARTLRLALFPLQFTAALQDRLAAYIDKSVRKVPEDRRVAPPQSLALDVCERLRNCDPRELVATLYIELLARAMDKERVGEAHPAFVMIIGQLAPDEVVLIEQLGKKIEDGKHPHDHVYVRDRKNGYKTFSKTELKVLVKSKISTASGLAVELFSEVEKRCVDQEALVQPEMFPTFLEHLVSLGLVEYRNDGVIRNGYDLLAPQAEAFVIRLNPFGRLFYKACVGERMATQAQ